MISSYEYKILRFIRRRKNCTSAQLIRRFGPGSVYRANALHEYIDRPFIREPDGSYSSIQEDNYFLTDAGHFALSEFSFIRRSDVVKLIIGYIAGILSTTLGFIITEHLLPAILQ